VCFLLISKRLECKREEKKKEKGGRFFFFFLIEGKGVGLVTQFKNCPTRRKKLKPPQEVRKADGKKRKGTLCTSAAQWTRGSSSPDSKEPTPHQRTAAHPDKLAGTTVSQWALGRGSAKWSPPSLSLSFVAMGLGRVGQGGGCEQRETERREGSEGAGRRPFSFSLRWARAGWGKG